MFCVSRKQSLLHCFIRSPIKNLPVCALHLPLANILYSCLCVSELKRFRPGLRLPVSDAGRFTSTPFPGHASSGASSVSELELGVRPRCPSGSREGPETAGMRPLFVLSPLAAICRPLRLCVREPAAGLAWRFRGEQAPPKRAWVRVRVLSHDSRAFRGRLQCPFG